MSSGSSAFAPRPSTNVPPASQAFEPLVKSVLSHRLVYNIFAYSAAFSLASTVFLADGDFILRLLRPGIWVNASLTWLVGVLPILVVRKVFLTPTPEPASSPSKTLAAALAKPSTRRWIAVYVASSLLLLSLQVVRIWSQEEDMRLTLFIQSRKHPYYLNGQLIFLVLAQAWLAISFALRNLMLERFVLRWAKAQPSANAPFIPRNLAMLLLTVTLFTFASFGVYNVAFGLARLVLLPLLLRVPLVRSLLRPFVGHFVRGSWTLTLPLRHLSLESHAFALGAFTLVNWEFAEALFDVYIPQPVKIASTTADPNVTLVSGITSTNPLYVHFAYAELCDSVAAAADALNSASTSSRRTALFTDQKFSPSLWSTLARESLLKLGEDYQTFLRKGTPAAAPAVASKTSLLSSQQQQPPPPSTPLLRKDIFRAPRQSPMSKVLDTFASDSDLARAADAVASEVGSGARGVVVDGPIPELFRSTSMSVSAPHTVAVPAPPPPTTTQPSLLGVYIQRTGTHCKEWVAERTPTWCKEAAEEWDVWWHRDRTNKLAEKYLANRDLDALIIQVLAGLVCASLTEDKYGVVQRDIPRILEAFLAFLSALEEYQVEVTKLYVPPTADEVLFEGGSNAKTLKEKERVRVEVAKAAEAAGVVVDALKSGIADITRTFGDKLVAFKFPPRIAQKLQSFVDYA